MANKEITFPVYRFTLALLIIIVFAVASISRSLGLFRHEMYWLQEALGGDQVTHMLMGAGLTVAGYLIIRPASRFHLMGVLMITVCILVLEEFSQIFLDTRQFDWLDLSMGVGGAALAVIVFYLCTNFDLRFTLRVDQSADSKTNGENR